MLIAAANSDGTAEEDKEPSDERFKARQKVVRARLLLYSRWRQKLDVPGRIGVNIDTCYAAFGHAYSVGVIISAKPTLNLRIFAVVLIFHGTQLTSGQ